MSAFFRLFWRQDSRGRTLFGRALQRTLFRHPRRLVSVSTILTQYAHIVELNRPGGTCPSPLPAKDALSSRAYHTATAKAFTAAPAESSLRDQPETRFEIEVHRQHGRQHRHALSVPRGLRSARTPARL